MIRVQFQFLFVGFQVVLMGTMGTNGDDAEGFRIR